MFQPDNTTFAGIGSAAQWLGYAAFALLSLLGVGRIVEMLFARFFARKDADKQIHATNQGKQIEAGMQAFNTWSERLDKVETKLEQVQEKLNSQLVANAELKAENKHCLDEKARQQGEIETLREENQKQELKIINLENELKRTRDDLKETHRQIDALQADFERLK